MSDQLMCTHLVHVFAQENYGTYQVVDAHAASTFAVPDFCSSSSISSNINTEVVMTSSSRGLRGSAGASTVRAEPADPMNCFI
jgi:hypothetical protein